MTGQDTKLAWVDFSDDNLAEYQVLFTNDVRNVSFKITHEISLSANVHLKEFLSDSNCDIHVSQIELQGVFSIVQGVHEAAKVHRSSRV